MVKSFSGARKIVQNFKPVSQVMMKNLNWTQKGDELYVGPYTVVEHKSAGSYVIKDVTGEQLKSAVTSKHLKLIKTSAVGPSYEVEKIPSQRIG